MTRPSRTPATTPASAVVAVLVAVALIGLGVVAGREFLIDRHVIDGQQWLRNLLEWIGRITWQSWQLPVAIVAVLVGALLLAIAVKPRNRTHMPTEGTPVLWLRTTDTARASTAAALRVDGIDRARTTARRRSIDVRVVTTGDANELAEQVATEVAKALHDLARPPRIKVAVELAGTP